MVERRGIGKSWRTAWPLFGLALLACSSAHDCFEGRDCDAPKNFIEAGAVDDWWVAGAGGESEQFDPGSAPSNAGASSTPEAGAGGESSAQASGPPRILSVTPADGASGLLRDTQIVIRFAQPMAEDSVESAFQSAELAPTRLSFVWNENATALTITPDAPLSYAFGAAQADGSPAFAAQVYRFGFDATSLDRAGRPLAAQSFAFSTLRQVAFTLPALAQLTGNWTEGEGEGVHNCLRSAKSPYAPSVCVGDDASNVRYTGLLSFDLSGLPDEITEFSSAQLVATAVTYGTPSGLGESQLEQVSFGELGVAATQAPALATLGPFYADATVIDESHLAINEDVSHAVSDDYENRALRNNRSQYRLSFANTLADWAWDDVELPAASIHLAATYLIP